MEQSLSQGWTLTGDTLDIRDMPVTMPSVVQQNLYEAGLVPHPYSDTVENSLLWVSDHPWTYTLTFNAERSILHSEVAELVFEGIDTYADVVLNGKELLSVDNMFRTWKAPVTGLLKPEGNVLEVRFPRYDSLQTALYEQHRPRLPERYAVSRKAPYQHGWDWAPRYKNVGVWKPVKLIGWSDARIGNAYVVTTEANESQAQLSLHLDVESCADVELVMQVSAQGVKKQEFVFRAEPGLSHKVFNFEVEHPRLWWPNGMGEQPLYDFQLTLKQNRTVLDTRQLVTGIKKVKMIQEPDDAGFCFYFKVNGVPFYAKGANYVPEEMIETWMKKDCTCRLLQAARDAHFNMLRVWGGGIYPSDDFFNCCDSLGILVWEDFMYAGTMYPYDEAFLDNAKMEALDQVKRLASHPSLALWCGGNEISEGYYNWGWQQSLGWSEEDDRAIKAGYDRLFEEILLLVVDTYDGTRPYWPSSPSKGWGRPESLTQGDVHYWGVWWGEQPYEMYREKVGRFNSEYGYQSYPDISTLKQAAGEDAAFKALCDYDGGNSDELYAMISQNAFVAAHQKHARGTRQINDFIEKYYPVPTDFEEYVYLSQLSQAYGMEVAIESHRIAKPYNMGTLYWQLNDAWPVTSWSSIDYYGCKKALQYKLKTLYAPVLLSLDLNGPQVFVTSDLLCDINGVLTVSVNDFNGKRLFGQKVKVEMSANQNKKYYVEGLQEILAKADPQKTYVKLELAETEVVLAERCCFLAYPKDLQLPKADLSLSAIKEDGHILIDVKSDVFAKDVQVCVTGGQGIFSDNFFDLEPGINKRIVFTPDDPNDCLTFSVRSLATVRP
ncbi:MAG: glycoside hydrolase family 2 protein [Bacteroidales bacterium]|nr:glycoside hydrolase family 2 protein [Bacteroidales bacterium]